MVARIDIEFRKSLQENADTYYALAKKAKRKLDGLDRGVAEVKGKMLAEGKKKTASKKLALKREKKWFEKYHWFITSEGFLAIAGRDAKGNESIVKKIMKKHDIYFHADIHGAPHTIILTNAEKVSDSSMDEAAVFAAVFSSAWREKIPAIDVYSAKPDQVTKAAPSGESIGKGAFMVYGKREWFKKTPLDFAVGFSKASSPQVFSGPYEAVKKRADFFVKISIGSDSKGEAAKKIVSVFSRRAPDAFFSVDELVSLLPNGGIKAEF